MFPFIRAPVKVIRLGRRHCPCCRCLLDWPAWQQVLPYTPGHLVSTKASNYLGRLVLLLPFQRWENCVNSRLRSSLCDAAVWFSRKHIWNTAECLSESALGINPQSEGRTGELIEGEAELGCRSDNSRQTHIHSEAEIRIVLHWTKRRENLYPHSISHGRGPPMERHHLGQAALWSWGSPETKIWKSAANNTLKGWKTSLSLRRDLGGRSFGPKCAAMKWEKPKPNPYSIWDQSALSVHHPLFSAVSRHSGAAEEPTSDEPRVWPAGSHRSQW